MRRLKLAIVATAIAVLTVGPLAPTSHAFGCPDPENPCDPTPVHPSDITHFVICTIKNC